jgi:hypothetical protein
MEIRELIDRFDHIEEAYEIVGEFEFSLGGKSPQRIRIKILKDLLGRGYTPLMSHHVKASGAATPHYPSFHRSDSIEAALKDALLNGLKHYSPDDEEAEWDESDSYY